jgi:hypothetical protein
MRLNRKHTTAKIIPNIANISKSAISQVLNVLIFFSGEPSGGVPANNIIERKVL